MKIKQYSLIASFQSVKMHSCNGISLWLVPSGLQCFRSFAEALPWSSWAHISLFFPLNHVISRKNNQVIFSLLSCNLTSCVPFAVEICICCIALCHSQVNGRYCTWQVGTYSSEQGWSKIPSQSKCYEVYVKQGLKQQFLWVKFS